MKFGKNPLYLKNPPWYKKIYSFKKLKRLIRQIHKLILWFLESLVSWSTRFIPSQCSQRWLWTDASIMCWNPDPSMFQNLRLSFFKPGEYDVGTTIFFFGIYYFWISLSHRKLDYLKTFIFVPPVSVLSVIYSIHS